MWDIVIKVAKCESFNLEIKGERRMGKGRVVKGK